MSAVRRVVLGSAGALGAFAAGRIVARPRHALPEVHGPELLGSARGRPHMIRGPRASRIHTERVGVEEGTSGALVFTHGWCVAEAIWHHQKLAVGAGRLAGGRLAAVTWDLPGHGHSTAVPRSHLTLDLAVESLARVVDETPGQGLVLVGHSLGGVLTIEYLLQHPETARRRVRGVVLVATPVTHTAARDRRWPGSAIPSRMLALGMQLAVQNSVVDRWFAREAGTADQRSTSYRLIRAGFGDDPLPEHIRFVRDLAASVPPSVRADTFRAMTGLDLRDRLEEIGTAALIVYGGRDRLVRPADSRALAASLRRARIHEFPTAGHAVFLEHHEEFGAVVGRFAASRLTRTRTRTRTAPAIAAPGPRAESPVVPPTDPLLLPT
jgi:pimeloyl-ACP methyl ester carboxylesterase